MSETIRDLHTLRGRQKWDEDPFVYKGWRTRPVWLAKEEKGKKRVHLTGLGDVGMNTALGLVLTGGDLIGEIGLYDLNERQCRRLETELSQIGGPFAEERFPAVTVCTGETLFDCEVFLFCATGGVPAVGSGITDVRMAQYETNRKILALYAREAARRAYKGLFVVVSDPVDLLCMEALRVSREMEETGRPLTTDQIAGCGLGVMHARACYFARKDPALSLYLQEGRAFGPHGEGLVIANSRFPAHYDDETSRILTGRTAHANLQVRELGYKPYLAPAMSSAVLSLLPMLRGEWNYSAAYLGGLYFGALNRQTADGVQWEEDALPPGLFARLQASYRELEDILWESSS